MLSGFTATIFFPPQSAMPPEIVPNVAKAGGIQSQGAKGEAVVIYREPLATQDLNPSGFPEG